MHAHTQSAIYACIHTHKPAQLFKKLRTIFFSTKHHNISNGRETRSQLKLGLIRNKLHKQTDHCAVVGVTVGFWRGGSSSIPNKFLFCCCCCCCSVLLMDLRLMLGVRQSVTGTYTKLIFKHILTTV